MRGVMRCVVSNQRIFYVLKGRFHNIKRWCGEVYKVQYMYPFLKILDVNTNIAFYVACTEDFRRLQWEGTTRKNVSKG